MSLLEISLLGPAKYRRSGTYLSLKSAKAVAILGYLATEEKPQLRDHLMVLFWPDSLPQSARKNLRNTLWNVRKVLGEDVIVTEGERVAVRSDIWIDVRIFQDPSLLVPPPRLEEIETAASLFQGALLEGLSVADAPEFELWLTAERQRLGQRYLRLLELLIAGYRSRSNWDKVIEIAQHALSWDNLQEPMHQILIESYGRQGDRSKAIQQYEYLTTLLKDELGIEPLAETKALYEGALGGKLARRPSITPSSDTSVPHQRQEKSASQAPFIGRITERELLNQEWSQVSRRQLRVVSLAGELGIGKTRLWQEWKNTLPADTTILETYCLDTNQIHPFGPILRLLRNDPCASALIGPASPVNPIWLAELNRLLPELRDLVPDLPEPLTLQPAEERLRLFEALTQMILYFGENPFIIFIDDLHWVDPVTLDWLVYMVDRLRDAVLLLVLAFRPDELPASVTQALAGWHRQLIAQRITLPPLSLSETTELLAKLGSDVAEAPTLQARSSGNPYFLVELGRAEPDTIPPGIVELINARLRSLPRRSRPLLQAASVLKGEFEVDVLERIAGQSHEETLDNLDLITEAGLFIEHRGEYSFAQPMAEALIYDDLSTARRRFLHAQAASALETVHSGRLGPVAADLAHHYAGSGHPQKAAHYADMAADWALGMSAPEDAAVFSRQAYLWEPTVERMTDLGRALIASGDLIEAQEAFRNALGAFEKEGDRVGAARAQLALAGSYAVSGERDQVVHWASRALNQLKGCLEPEMEAQGYLMMGIGGVSVISRLTDAERNLMKASEIAEANNLTQVALQSQFERANVLAQRGELEEAVKLFALTAEQARAKANPVQEMLAYNNLAYHEHLLGDTEAARAHIDMALAMSENYSLSPFNQFLFSTRGEIALATGELMEAELWFERAMAAAIVANNQSHQANLKASMGMLAQAQGDLDSALLLLQEARSALPAEGESFLRIKIELWIVELHIARGERAAAAEVLRRVKSILETSEYEGYKRRADAIKLE